MDILLEDRQTFGRRERKHPSDQRQIHAIFRVGESLVSLVHSADRISRKSKPGHGSFVSPMRY